MMQISSSPQNVNSYLLVVIFILCSIIIVLLSSKSKAGSFDASTTITSSDEGKCSKGPSISVGEGSATSGKLFLGNKVKNFEEPLLFKTLTDKDLHSMSNTHTAKLDELQCSKWSVVTTIFEPSAAVQTQALLRDWCIVVVGDKKGPLQYEINTPLKNFIFLSESIQKELENHFPMIKILPWNHFGRKNVGFLYAILHGAKIIWDFDDDNGFPSNSKDFVVAGMNFSQSWVDNNISNPIYLDALEPKGYKSIVFNPYPFMVNMKNAVWPRGFPLEKIKYLTPNVSREYRFRTDAKKLPLSSVGIIQSLANHDPDVDAIYRLTQPLPFNFLNILSGGSNALLVPDDAYAPYNAQATLHFYDSFWSLLLPVSVHGRVSDIWRGYFAQRIGRDIGMRMAFSTPSVSQYRNSHNYIADFQSEQPLYLESLKLVEQLHSWNSSCATMPGRIEELWVFLYEHGYIGVQDVHLVQSWLHALISAGYKYPLFHEDKNKI
eukprot:gene6993-9557_t